MVRPRKQRLVSRNPQVEYFKPRGIPMKKLEESRLPLEGYEALRLADIKGLTQEQAASFMGISRHTFGRVLNQARQIVAQAVVFGRALRIEGGDYCFTGCKPHSGCGQKNLNPEKITSEDTAEDRQMKKIAISSEGPTLNDLVDPRFGRAAGFLIIDQTNRESSYVENGQNQTRSQGAGIGAAELMAQHNVGVVLTGFVGPKAFQALEALGIQVGQNLDNMTADQALQKFLDGQVEMAQAPNR